MFRPVDPVIELKRLKIVYLLFGTGCLLFIIGFFFLIFCRPYVHDRTNKDLFLPFGILLMASGGFVSTIMGFLIYRQWRIFNNFMKLNEETNRRSKIIPDNGPTTKNIDEEYDDFLSEPI